MDMVFNDQKFGYDGDFDGSPEFQKSDERPISELMRVNHLYNDKLSSQLSDSPDVFGDSEYSDDSKKLE